MIIAVDFDGTIVEHKYPEIGRELPFAIETLKKLQQERHRLILWINPEKPDVPLNKNDAFQKVQKRRVQEKR